MAVYTVNETYYKRLPNTSTIFSAELKALVMALEYISQSQKDKFIIFSDSLSSLQALQGNDSENIFAMQIIEGYKILSEEYDKTVMFCWIPSHIGIPGNETADRAAKTALDLPITEMPIHYADFKTRIKDYTNLLWQQRWDQQIHNKLHEVKPDLNSARPSVCAYRREEVVLSRLRIGHTYLTHIHLLKRENPPQCVACQCTLTVKHILVECADFLQIREKYYDTQDMKELFEEVCVENIFGYLKEIGIFKKI